MDRVSTQMRSFAKRLILCEAGGNQHVKMNAANAFAVCEKLRPQLATLMGNGGFRALLSRGLALASAEVPWLRDVHVESDGTLAGLEKLPASLELDEFLEGGVVLLAHLLGLLVAFIGESLTVRLAREVWPKARLDGLELTKGNDNEKTK
jgi:hypothetical protein